MKTNDRQLCHPKYYQILVYQWMIQWLMNNELERIWKEVVMPVWRYYRGIFLMVLRKTMKHFCYGSQYQRQGPNWVLTKHKSETLSPKSTWLFNE
jgi:hypothetical protein